MVLLISVAVANQPSLDLVAIIAVSNQVSPDLLAIIALYNQLSLDLTTIIVLCIQISKDFAIAMGSGDHKHLGNTPRQHTVCGRPLVGGFLGDLL